MQQESLFEDKSDTPLASRLRPMSLDKFVGQNQIFSTQRKSFSKFLAGRILKNLGFHNYLDHGISLLSLKSHETFGSLFCFSYGILQLAIILLLPQQVPCDAGGSSPPPPPEATDQTRLRKN